MKWIWQSSSTIGHGSVQHLRTRGWRDPTEFSTFQSHPGEIKTTWVLPPQIVLTLTCTCGNVSHKIITIITFNSIWNNKLILNLVFL